MGTILRALTYLAPGIPRAFFEGVTEHLARALDCEIQLASEERSSGPMHGDSDPFSSAAADIGFLCSPSYLYLRSQPDPSVQLVHAGFVFSDSRHSGQPVYFSDVVVRADHPARSLDDLEGGVWGYNDECSLSGYFSTLQELARRGGNESFFDRWERTGSHHGSLERVLEGFVDGVAVDSVALTLLLRARPDLRGLLRILDSFGPFPIQPVVVRTELASTWSARIADALLALGPVGFGLEGCVPIDDSAYAEERRALCSLGHLPA